MDDINLVLHEITLNKIETLNLIDNIHRPKGFRMKRYITFWWIISFLVWNCKR